jgi:hydroxymethylglutaryl-CoA lyase
MKKKLNSQKQNSKISKQVTLVEVGLRDGLQNESVFVSVDTRIQAAQKLIDAGLQKLEIGSFVRADWVPQMAGSHEVITKLLALQKKKKISSGVEFSALVPNAKGFEGALQTGIQEIAVFASCSEGFSQKNLNCSIQESFERFEKVFALAKKHKLKVRGYLSVCFGCPIDGEVPETRVVKIAQKLIQMGAYEVSIGDTIGIAHIQQIESLFTKLKKVIPVHQLAGHFHDTRGQALANILMAYNLGIRVFDTSIGGLGGCPYAPGATGNVATEDVAYMFSKMKVLKKIQLEKLIETSQWLGTQMNKQLPSKVALVKKNKSSNKKR